MAKVGAPVSINWSDSEKVSLLLEIIKEKNVVPDWKSIKLPQGRTIASAQAEYLKLTSSFPIRRPPVKAEDNEDEDMEDVDDSNSATSAPTAKKQRRESSDEEATSTTDGAASSNGSENGNAVFVQQTTTSTTTAAQQNPLIPVKRKRGRPTKAESEARKAAQLRGEQLPPKPPSYTPVKTPVYTVGPDGVQRRRRGRPSKAEVAARKAAEEAAMATGTTAPVTKTPATAPPAVTAAVKADAA